MNTRRWVEYFPVKTIFKKTAIFPSTDNDKNYTPLPIQCEITHSVRLMEIYKNAGTKSRAENNRKRLKISRTFSPSTTLKKTLVNN
jgi:hypothetical protein